MTHVLSCTRKRKLVQWALAHNAAEVVLDKLGFQGSTP